MVIEDKRNGRHLVSFKEIKCGEMFTVLIDDKEWFYIKCVDENKYYGVEVDVGVVYAFDMDEMVTPIAAKIVIEKAGE